CKGRSMNALASRTDAPSGSNEAAVTVRFSREHKPLDGHGRRPELTAKIHPVRAREDSLGRENRRAAVVSVPGLGAAIARRALRWLLRILFRVQIAGDASVFRNDRTLIVANHESFLDGLLLGVFFPVAATFVVHTEVKKNALVRWLLRFVPHLTVDSTSPMAI